MSRDDLLPCPFCGGKPKLQMQRCAEDAEVAFVTCQSCFASTDHFEDAYAPTADAVDRWNTRATPIPDTSAGERERTVQPSIATKQSTNATAASVLSDRPCTCHPDDSPPMPCPQKYALSHCRHSERYQVVDMQPSPVSVSAFAAWHPVHGFGPVNEIALRDQVDHAQTDVNLLRHSGDSLWEVVRVEVHKGHWF